MSATPAAPDVPIRPAATVILVRDAGHDWEIFMLRRTSQAAFAGGMYVFPGGRVDDADHAPDYRALARGPSPAQSAQAAALGDDHLGYWVAGIRESFEEAGLLLAYDRRGAIVRFDDDDAAAARFTAARHALHHGDLTLAEFCAREQLELAVDRIHFWNRWVTPPGRPRRFDTRFFIAEAPPDQTGVHDDKETVASTWVSPGEALARHAAGDLELMAVTRMQLETLAQHPDAAAVLEFARTNSAFPVTRPTVPRT